MKKNILTIAAFLFSVLSVFADNISVPDVTIVPGTTTTLSISLDNTETNLVSFQMDLTLPDGITINKAGCSLSSRFTDEDQELTIGKQGDNVYRLTSTSFALTPISGTSGQIVTLSLTASADCGSGTATLSNIRFVTSQSEKLTLDDTSFNMTIRTTGITLDKTSLQLYNSGETATLVATIVPANATDKSVTWTSSDTSVATVGEDGTVTAVADGTTTVTATTNDGTNLSASCEVRVSPYDFDSNDIYYRITDATARTLEVTYVERGEGNADFYFGNITIPNRISKNGVIYTVTGIGEEAFHYCNNLTSITIGNNVTSIGRQAFMKCTSLTSVSLPNGLLSIGYSAFDDCYALASINLPSTITFIDGAAFSDCRSLTSITLPEGIPSIGDWAFDNCAGLTEIVIPESVTSIGQSAFSGCWNLASVSLPSGLTSIGKEAFMNCNTFTSIVIPASVTSIGVRAFAACPNVTSVVVEEGNTTYDSRNNCNAIVKTAMNKLVSGCQNTVIPEDVTVIGEYAFYYCTGLTSIAIPEGVTSIESSAFRSCTALTEITIPASVTSIEGYAFEECTSLTSVTALMQTPVTISSNVFSNRANATLTVPFPTKYLYEAADYWKEFKEIVQMDGPVAIGDTFPAPVPCGEATTDLTFKVTNVSPLEVDVSASPEDIAGALTIPSTVQDENGFVFNVKGIAPKAFEARTNLISVEIPSGVWKIGEFSFQSCTSLETAILPNSVTHIGCQSFNGCTSLTSVAMPETIVSIDLGAFAECHSLTSITIPSGLQTLSVKTFCNCFNLTDINLPEGLTEIQHEAFLHSGLESIKFPSTLTSVEQAAFRDCKSLANIDFNGSTAEINGEAFRGTAIESLIIPTNITIKGWEVFAWCGNLKSVIIENPNTAGNHNIFSHCTNLETVVLPSTNVMGGGGNNFGYCSSLKNVTFLTGDAGDRHFTHNFSNTPDDVLFVVPEGTAENFLRRGYKNLSDKSGLPMVREEFENEAARITAMADAAAEGDIASLTAAINDARSIVNSTDDYMTVYAKIAAIKTAAKAFIKTASLPENFDVTAATITNADFDRYDIGWNTNYIGHLIGSQGDAGYTHLENDGIVMDRFMEAWNWLEVSLSSGRISQSIITLPVGNYRLEADIIATNQSDANAEVTGVSLFAGSTKTAVATENNKPQHFSVEFTQYEDADCTIGVDVTNTNANWVAMDNVRLYRLGGEVPAAVVDANETYYLQNVETGKFLNQGNSWGTHAVLKDEGLPLRITRLPDGSYTFYFLEGSAYEHLLFRTGPSYVYVDYQSSQENQCPYWTITATDVEGIFHIQSLVTDSRYGQQVYPGTYLGNNPTKEAVNHDGTHFGVYNDVDGNITDTEGMNLKWRFVEQEQYDTRNRNKDLEKLIGYAQASGTDVSAAEAVANDVNASSEEITTAIEELRVAYLAKLNEGVSVDLLPLDVSGLIVNADFDHNDSYGWTNSETEGTSGTKQANEHAYEFWNTSFDFHQTLSGLPNGNYLLKMKGFHHTGNHSQYGEPTAVLYANGESQVLRSILDGMTEGKLNYDDWTVDDDGTTCYVPANMAGAAARFAKDMYWNEVPVTVTDGELTIGVKLDNYTNSCWVMFDEFRLILLQRDNINKLYADENTAILPSGETTLKLNLKNEDEIIMTDFFLQLPEGFNIAENASGNPDVTLSSNRSNGHIVTAQQNGDGYYHVVCYSSKNNALIGNDGILFNIKLQCSEDVAAGNYTVAVKSILMTDVGRNSITQSDFSFNIEVPDLQLGDVNNDGNINGLDIVEMVDHIMHRPSENFKFLAADLNFDEKINGLDLVKLVKLVLNQDITPNASHAPAMRRNAPREGWLTLKDNGRGSLTMGVDSSDGFLLAQCVVEVSEGMQLKNITVDGSHVVAWQPIDERRYAVVAYSAKNDVFGTNGSLLTFDCSGKGSLMVSSVMLVDSERNERHFAPAGLDVVTGLEAVGMEGSADTYDLQGRKMADDRLPKGVYIINGKKVVVR